MVCVAILLIVAVVAGWGGWYMLAGAGSADPSNRGVLTHTVGRADLLVTVTDDGTLQSSVNIDVKCEVAGGGTILWLVEDGKHVEVGEKIVELDPATITEQLNVQRSIYEQARALKIQAEQNLAAAEIAVREYKEGTYLQAVQTADSAIRIAEQNLSSSENTLAFTKKMLRKGFATQLQVEADQFAVDRAKLDLDAAETAKRVLQEFTYEKTVKGLEATAEAAAAQLTAENATFQNEEDKLKLLETQLAKCVIVAPSAGMVIYANDNRSWRGSSEPEIYEGAVVRDRQTILRLPDLTKMQVKTTVHESKVDQLRQGMPARVVIQGKPHTGHVVSIANQPESQSFMAANVKEYATIVAVDGSPTGLRPGMTAEVTILIAEINDALTLPVTAVVEKPDGYYGYVKSASGIEERKLTIGRTNDTYIEIQDGVKEGDLVVRNPRAVVPEARSEVALVDRASSRSQFGEAQTVQSDNGAGGGRGEAGRDGGRRRGGRGEGQGGGGEGGGGRQRPSASEIVKQSDKDGDGTLSRDEVPDPMKEFFDRADADKDGFITSSELAAGMRARGGQGRGEGRRGDGDTSGQSGSQPAGAAQ